MSKLKDMIKNKPFVFINGNHDFIDPYVMEHELNFNLIKAFDVTNKIVNVENTNFYGFSYIPETGGGWANELNLKSMQLAVNELIDVLKNNSIDVLLLHCPPIAHHGFQYSNKILANALNYLSDEHKPKLICSGHIHSDNGISNEFGILHSNAATTQHIIKI
jgi:Icc-related predicted phosphoesterase